MAEHAQLQTTCTIIVDSTALVKSLMLTSNTRDLGTFTNRLHEEQCWSKHGQNQLVPVKIGEHCEGCERQSHVFLLTYPAPLAHKVYLPRALEPRVIRFN